MFQIYTDELRRSGNAIRDGSEQLKRDVYEIEEVKQLLTGLSSFERIKVTLSALQNEVRHEADQETALSETALRIARSYEDCEETVIGNMDDGKFGFIVANPVLANFKKIYQDTKKVNREVLDELMGLFY